MIPWLRVAVTLLGKPELAPDEVEVAVASSVGLYQGRAKAVDYQDGRVYLTSRRLIWVDGARGVSIRLAAVAAVEHLPKWLRSSPKALVYLRNEPAPTHDLLEMAWDCPVCHHVNTSKSMSPPPPCSLCGVKASAAAVATARAVQAAGTNVCPRCTFDNHPLLTRCEMCDMPLVEKRSEAVVMKTDPEDDGMVDGRLCIKLSFRGGGDRLFTTKLAEELERARWNAIQAAGGVNAGTEPPPDKPQRLAMGISSLQLQHESVQQSTAAELAGALADMDALEARASTLTALALRLAQQLARAQGEPVRPAAEVLAAAALPSKRGTPQYLQELARLLLAYWSQELAQCGGRIPLVDAYARYNRARGIGLVPVEDVGLCLPLLDALALPVTVKTYASGTKVVVARHAAEPAGRIAQYVRERERDHYAGLRAQLEAAAMQVLTEFELEFDRLYASRHQQRFQGVRVADVATRFGWSRPVAQEELERAALDGHVVVDQQPAGVFYHVNRFGRDADWAAVDVDGWVVEGLREMLPQAA